jgi:hypothetical protein
LLYLFLPAFGRADAQDMPPPVCHVLV